jgi:flagellar hook-associated protein 2
MAGIQAAGIGSGLDIASLVSQLVAAERQPLDARLTRRESSATVELSALGSLRGALGALRDALAPLRSTTAFAVRTAVSADEDIFTASATGAIAPGTYDVEVVNLATAHRLASAAFASGGGAYVGSGMLTISVGGDAFSVEVPADAGTLADIRNAINAATDNAGVTASIINEIGGSRLVLTARQSGAASGIEVSQSGGDGGLAALTYDPNAPLAAGLTQTTAAADAVVRINGFEHRGASNSVSGAIEGLTLTLRSADPGNSYLLTVGNDTGEVTKRIRKFVSDYNATTRVMADLQKYDAASGRAGELIGDAFVRGLESQLRGDVTGLQSQASASQYRSLASLGIRSDASGQLTLDESKLAAALAADFDGVAALFVGDTGIAARAYQRLEAALASDGSLTTRTDALNRKVREIGRERDAIDRRMEIVEARYQAQFSALDRLLAQLQSTSSYLDQQLSALQSLQSPRSRER